MYVYLGFFVLGHQYVLYIVYRKSLTDLVPAPRGSQRERAAVAALDKHYVNKVMPRVRFVHSTWQHPALLLASNPRQRRMLRDLSLRGSWYGSVVTPTIENAFIFQAL